MISCWKKWKWAASLINVGSCDLNTVHGVFKTSFEKGAWEIRKILKGAYSVFHDSPTKRDYTTKTGSTQFPQYERFLTNCIEVNFCATF